MCYLIDRVRGCSHGEQLEDMDFCANEYDNISTACEYLCDILLFLRDFSYIILIAVYLNSDHVRGDNLSSCASFR